MSAGASEARTFVLVCGEGAAWAVDARKVSRIATEEEWSGEAPVDAGDVVGVPALPGERPRVLVLEASAGPVAVAVGVASITLLPIDPAEVLELPPELLTTDRARALAGVILGEGAPPILVLDATRLVPKGVSSRTNTA